MVCSLGLTATEGEKIDSFPLNLEERLHVKSHSLPYESHSITSTILDKLNPLSPLTKFSQKAIKSLRTHSRSVLEMAQLLPSQEPPTAMKQLLTKVLKRPTPEIEGKALMASREKFLLQ